MFDLDASVDPEFASRREALGQELEKLLSELRQRTAERARIAELTGVMQEEFERGGGWQGRTPEDVAAFYQTTRPQQQEIDQLQQQYRDTLARIQRFGQEVRQYLVDCAIKIPAAEPLLDRGDQLLREFVNRPVAPDTFLLKLRGLLGESLEHLRVLSDTQPAGPEPPEAAASLSSQKTQAAEARKRYREPDLQTSKNRIALLEQLSSELATIRQKTHKYTTLQELKAKYPEFKIWEILPESEQRELLGGEFKPKAYAVNLVLRQYGLSSPEALRKDRRKLRQAAK
jgi:hypothetical protein